MDDPRGKCPAHFHQRPHNEETRIRVLHELEEARETQILLTKRWEGNSLDQMKHLLKQLCLLEYQDPSVFLPTNQLDGLFDPNGNDNDEIGTVFHANINEVGWREYPKTSMTIPAILKISRKNQRQWLVYGPPKTTIDDEMMFFGELYVSSGASAQPIPATLLIERFRIRWGSRKLIRKTKSYRACCRSILERHMTPRCTGPAVYARGLV